MLSSVTHSKKAVIQELQSNYKHLKFSVNCWIPLEQLQKILRPFTELAETISLFVIWRFSMLVSLNSNMLNFDDADLLEITEDVDS